MSDSVFICGNIVEINEKPKELFKSAKSKNSSLSRTILDVSDVKYPRSSIDYSWLSSASKVYNISSDIRDYIVVPVPIITSNIPNRNSQAFDAKDLISFDSNCGRMLYQTFIGKPTFINHENQVLSRAKGVNLDVTAVPVKKYNLIKIVVLSAFDRTKDKDLVKGIQRGRNGYSMGALAKYFQCSICNGVLGPAVDRTCTCLATDYTNLSSLGNIVNGRLHYHMAKEFGYIENSWVSDPADYTATTDKLL